MNGSHDTSTNTSLLDRLYKKTGNKVLTHSGLQLAKPLDARENIVTLVMEVVDYFCGVSPPYILQER